MSKQAWETPTYSRNRPFRYRATKNSDGRVEYEGWAETLNAATSDAVWQICKHTYDSTGFQTQVDWANGCGKFDKTWDNRATYTYT